MNLLVILTSKLATNIVGIERIKEYENIPQESSAENLIVNLPKEWPTGNIEFRNVNICYGENQTPALSNLNAVIRSGEKIGIWGRTGAGKSSFALSLFRTFETTRGKIFIGGVDISQIGLSFLRSKLTMIPQEPILFEGTLRTNLDPSSEYEDWEIWRALKLVHLDKMFLRELLLVKSRNCDIFSYNFNYYFSCTRFLRWNIV